MQALSDVKPVNGYVKLTVEGKIEGPFDYYHGVGEWPDASRIRIVVGTSEAGYGAEVGATLLVKQDAICGVLGEPIKAEESRIIIPDKVKQGALTLLK